MILDSMGRHAGSDCDCGHDIFCLVPIKIRIMMEGSRGAMLAQCRRQHWVLPILTVNGVHERPAKSKRVVNHNRSPKACGGRPLPPWKPSPDDNNATHADAKILLLNLRRVVAMPPGEYINL
ncbi:hypothetical protein AB1N83_007047 [Pleurotus pulmonarius]